MIFETNKNAIKRSLIIVISLILCFISFTVTSHAASKIKINKKTAIIRVGTTVKLKIKGTKKKVKWKSSNKKVATVTSKGLVRAKKAGRATITATVKGKKYKCKIWVYNLVYKTSPYHMSNYSCTKYSGDNYYTIQFKLLDKNYNELSNAVGNIKVNIINKDNKNVYSKTLNFSGSNYSQANNGAYYYYVKIPLSSISPGTKSKGTAHIEVFGNNYNFSEFTNEVSDLPLKPLKEIVKINLPSVPITLHNLDRNNNIEQTYVITNIKYTVEEGYDGTYTVTLHLDGKKTYDARGKNQGSTMNVSYRLKQGNVVKNSGTIYTVSLFEGEEFTDKIENIYDMAAGEYTLSLTNTN